MVARAAAVQDTEQRILQAARQVFREQVYDQVSLPAVAHRAGVSVQTLLRRFQSKERLFGAVAAHLSRLIVERVSQVPAGDVALAVSTLLDRYEELGDERLHFLSQELRSEPMRAVVEAGRRNYHAWIERVFGPLLHGLAQDERRQRLAQLTTVLDLYGWKVLRRDLGLSAVEVQDALMDLVLRLLENHQAAGGKDAG
jgi:AcrR family transcriptional regulator